MVIYRSYYPLDGRKFRQDPRLEEGTWMDKGVQVTVTGICDWTGYVFVAWLITGFPAHGL
jgi:hypothetical protein